MPDCDIHVCEQLEACCRKALKEMDDAITLGNVGAALMLTAPLLVWLGSSPPDIALQEVTSWVATRKAPTASPAQQLSTMQLLAFRACSSIASRELDKHAGDPREKTVTAFWKAMTKKFDYEGY